MALVETIYYGTWGQSVLKYQKEETVGLKMKFLLKVLIFHTYIPFFKQTTSNIICIIWPTQPSTSKPFLAHCSRPWTMDHTTMGPSYLNFRIANCQTAEHGISLTTVVRITDYIWTNVYVAPSGPISNTIVTRQQSMWQWLL